MAFVYVLYENAGLADEPGGNGLRASLDGYGTVNRFLIQSLTHLTDSTTAGNKRARVGRNPS